jgi:hypothetical protein
LKGPSVEIPDVTIPSVDIDVKGPKIKAPSIDLDMNASKVKVPDFSIKGPQVKAPKADIDIKVPSVDLQGPHLDLDLNSPDVKGGIKGFFKGMGGKIQTPQLDSTVNIDAGLPNLEIKSPRIKTPKIDLNLGKSSDIDLEISNQTPKLKTPKMDLPDVDFQSPNDAAAAADIKGFFKDMGGKIKVPDLNVVKGSRVDLDISVPKIKTPKINADVDFSSKLNFAPGDLFYGVDMPVTIVNNDYIWSQGSLQNDRILQRSFIDSSSHTAEKNTVQLGHESKPFYYPFGNHNILDQTHLSTSPIEFELKKAKIRKDPLNSVNNNLTGDINFEDDPKTKSNGGSGGGGSFFFRRKLSSASSVSNIAQKKQQQQPTTTTTTTSSLNVTKSQLISRSESADPSTRRHNKVDYSLPRKCSIMTRPEFDGLGIHIACDKKTRLSPYIHEVESDSPGCKAGLRKNDYILEVNSEDAVCMEFTCLITKIQTYIKENNLSLTVGNEKAHKKWIKSRQSARKTASSRDVNCKEFQKSKKQ